MRFRGEFPFSGRKQPQLPCELKGFRQQNGNHSKGKLCNHPSNVQKYQGNADSLRYYIYIYVHIFIIPSEGLDKTSILSGAWERENKKINSPSIRWSTCSAIDFCVELAQDVIARLKVMTSIESWKVVMLSSTAKACSHNSPAKNRFPFSGRVLHPGRLTAEKPENDRSGSDVWSFFQGSR